MTRVGDRRASHRVRASGQHDICGPSLLSGAGEDAERWLPRAPLSLRHAGVWCRQIDALGTSASAQQSAGSWLRYDPATWTLTVQEGVHALLTYPAGGLFEGP